MTKEIKKGSLLRAKKHMLLCREGDDRSVHVDPGETVLVLGESEPNDWERRIWRVLVEGERAKAPDWYLKRCTEVL